VDRKFYRWISHLVRDKPDQATIRPFTVTGQQVQTRFGCGFIRNNRLIFSAEDKRQLRRRLMDEIGLDPFVTEQLPESRLEMAQYHSNEKLANRPVSGDQVFLNSADGVIRLNGREIHLHPESLTSAALLCLSSSIRSVEHRTIVIVENLSIMPLCHSWQIPCIDRQALWLYRGDYKTGAQAKACHDFIERFGPNKTIIVFSDMDPKGLEIALTIPFAEYWLGPSRNMWQHLLNSKYASQIGYDTQSQAIAYLLGLLDSTLLSATFRNLISVLCDTRSSFRQEHTYSHSVTLELIPIRAK
jgi:hypothetical protein